MFLARSLMRVTCSSSTGFRRKTFSLVKKERDHIYKTITVLHITGQCFYHTVKEYSSCEPQTYRACIQVQAFHKSEMGCDDLLFHSMTLAGFSFIVPCCIILVVSLNSIHKSSNHFAASFLPPYCIKGSNDHLIFVLN